MNTKLFIADKIKVGFNQRTDTYTGMLGYVIGFDGKKWRKEPSWESWREKYISPEEFEANKKADFENIVKNQTNYFNSIVERVNNGYSDKHYLSVVAKGLDAYLKDSGLSSYNNFKYYSGEVKCNEKVKPVEYENVPVEGFVLNKKAGGYSSGWNHRSTYCRVYDPRGFEFEISIPNLLFILQECNAMKGKGLEGSFVYAWDGKDLVLLPTTCQEFKESEKFTKLQSGKVSVKDLVEGCTYKSKNMDEHVYLGKFDWYSNYKEGIAITKQYVFKTISGNKYQLGIKPFSSLSSFVQRITDIPVSNYADLLDEFNKSKNSGSIGDVKVIDFNAPRKTNNYRDYKNIAYKSLGDNKFEVYELTSNNLSGNGYPPSYTIRDYNVKLVKIIVIKDNGSFDIKATKPNKQEGLSFSEVDKMGLKTISVDGKILIF